MVPAISQTQAPRAYVCAYVMQATVHTHRHHTTRGSVSSWRGFDPHTGIHMAPSVPKCMLRVALYTISGHQTSVSGQMLVSTWFVCVDVSKHQKKPSVKGRWRRRRRL